MKVVKQDDKNIFLEVQPGIFLNIHRHAENEIELQFAGVDNVAIKILQPHFHEI